MKDQQGHCLNHKQKVNYLTRTSLRTVLNSFEIFFKDVQQLNQFFKQLQSKPLFGFPHKDGLIWGCLAGIKIPVGLIYYTLHNCNKRPNIWGTQ